MRIHSPDEMLTLASENIMSKCSNVPLMTEFDVILKVSFRIYVPVLQDCRTLVQLVR